MPQIGEPTSEANEPEEEITKWRVQLLDLDGNGIGNKKFEMKKPLEKSGTLDGSGKTPIYDEKKPASASGVQIKFELKVLPKISVLFANYPGINVTADPVNDTGLPYDIGGEYEDLYDNEADRMIAAGLDRSAGDYYNTCVARTSVAFNAAAHSDIDYTIPWPGRGHGIPRGTLPDGLKVRRYKGDKTWPDGSNYAYAISVIEFEPFLKATYPDAPIVSGSHSSEFADVDGVITFVGRHFDIIMGGSVKYNDLSVNQADWSGSIRVFQHVVIRPVDDSKVEGDVETFFFQMFAS